MKIPAQSDKAIDLRIERVEFSTVWLRIGGSLVGFSPSQRTDVELGFYRP